MSNSSKASIAVLLPTHWTVRNIVHAGVLQHLSRDACEANLLVRGPVSASAGEVSAAASCQPLLVSPGRAVRGKAFLDDVLRSAFNRRYGNGSYSLYQSWYRRHQSLLHRVRFGIVERVGALAQARASVDALRVWAEKVYRRSHELSEIRAQLERLAPDLIWSTESVAGFEYPYLLAARDLGIPVISSILSFDNLTSRGLLPQYDHYLVWSNAMRDQLLHFYPEVKPDEVTVTGTPQFDFHRKPSFLWSRQQTLKSLGLPQDARFFLYATSFKALTPAEPDLVAELIRQIEKSALKDFWLVIRVHPIDDWARWQTVGRTSPKVVLSRAVTAEPDAANWRSYAAAEQARLISSLTYTEACLNIASTITLDSAILDRPVIGIDFTDEPNSPREIMFQEFGAVHYKPLVQSGGLRVARSWSELISLMQQAVSAPGHDAQARARMVAEVCGRVDGRNAERMARAVTDFLVKRGLTDPHAANLQQVGVSNDLAQPQNARV